MCSQSSFILKHAVKLLTSPKHAVKLLASPKHAVKLLTSPKYAVKLLPYPKYAVMPLPYPKYAVKLLPNPKYAVMLLLSSSPWASTLRSCSPSPKHAVKLILPRPPCTLQTPAWFLDPCQHSPVKRNYRCHARKISIFVPTVKKISPLINTVRRVIVNIARKTN